MAHVTNLGLLTDELITILTGTSSKTNSTKFNAYRETALRTLRYNSYASTNQFDIQHQLEGLEEKFRVYNEDDLAEALHNRLGELSRRSAKWVPEVLHLLLELSDKPVVKSSLDSLEFLKLSDDRPEPHYTWEELAADDPLLSDRNVWRNINYGSESSGDDEVSRSSDLDNSSQTGTTTLSSTHNSFLSRTEEITIIPDHEGLYNFETAQFWNPNLKSDTTSEGENGVKSLTSISELQVIREVLFLLSGLPTSLFRSQRRHQELPSATQDRSTPSNTSRLSLTGLKSDYNQNIYVPAPKYIMTHVSPQIFHGMITQICGLGTSIMFLRGWAKTNQSVPLLQSFQHEIIDRLRHFDCKLSSLQKQLLDSSNLLAISFLGTQIEVNSLARPLLKLSDIVRRLDSELYAHAFRCLELLYEDTCTSQIAGDYVLYEFLGTLFFDCFRVYLNPIRLWMEEGELRPIDKVFFVTEMVGEMELASIWSDRYKLRKTSTGRLHAPNFLHPAVQKIFTTGKSVVILKQLGKYESTRSLASGNEPNLRFETVCEPQSLSYAPFPELFDIAFEEWIKSKHSTTSATLRQCLFDDCGLRASLNAMNYLYFMADGATATSLSNAIFQRLDGAKTSWNDGFALTELVQSTVGSLFGVTAERLRTRTSRSTHVDTQKSRGSVLSLNAVAFTYALPWPVQIIVTKDTIPQYQGIFSFLLQIRRSSSKLQSIRLGHGYSRTDEQAFYGLRSRLLWFTSSLYSYLTDLVICTNTVQMHMALAEAEDIDQMIETHQAYMKRIIDQALLGSRLEPIYKTIITILDLSIQVSDAQLTYTSIHNLESDRRASIYHSSNLQEEVRVRQQRLQRNRASHSSDEDDNDKDTEAYATIAEDMDLPFVDCLKRMRAQFDGLCNFVATGLRGVARAGGEPNWDMLADKLETTPGKLL